MKLQFKHQKFQADAAKAVVDVFAGQPYLTPTYMMDRGDGNYQIGLEDDTDFTGWRNERIVPELSDKLILEHLQKVQRTNQIKPSDKLEGRYNLTIEMETGVGKTYGAIQVAEEVADSRDSVINILDSVYDSRAMQPENARDKNVELQVDPDKLAMPEFKALWKRISPKSVYMVDFDTDELVDKAIVSINRNLRVPKIFFKVETGAMDEIKSKDSLLDGSAFSKSKSSTYDSRKQIRTNSSVKYDLIGKLVGETGLTRKAVVAILTGIEKPVFEQFKFNPEEFIIKAAALINDEKATAIIQHITYNVLDERYDTDIFTEPTIKGKLGTNAMKAQRHLYDHIVYDSTNERDFATDLDTNTDVAVYVKLPDSFYIATPVGHYNPDWAIAFYEGSVKHIYFVAETKGTLDSMHFNHITPVEQAKIDCARVHFKAISDGNVVYDVVDSYQTLLEKVMK